MLLLEKVNSLSKRLLGIGVLDIHQLAAKTKIEAQNSYNLAQTKRLREAIQVAERILATWSATPGFWERLLRQWLLGNRLEQLNTQLKQWREQTKEANKLAQQAKAVLQQDTNDPEVTQFLEHAIALYQHCTQILRDERVLAAIKRCKHELQKRQQFQSLVAQAAAKAEEKFFQLAIATYSEAERLYAHSKIQAAIAICTEQVQHEKIYEATLQRVQQGYEVGRLQSAISGLESALTEFPRSDGIRLLDQLKQTLKGKEKFRQGLKAEQLAVGKENLINTYGLAPIRQLKADQIKALKEAESLYEAAILFLPDPTECQIRLGIIAIKLTDWSTALRHLEKVKGEQAAYLRGFAQAQQGNLQMAYREWQSLSGEIIEFQREMLKQIVQRQRLLVLQNIQKLTQAGELEKSAAASEAFIQKFGADLTVQFNLNDHIQPRLAATLWQSADWSRLTTLAEETWFAQLDLTSLHNWVVAAYYHAQDNPTQLVSLIGVWSTALVNLSQDQALYDIPWMGHTSVDYNAVFLELKKRLEILVDGVKEAEINQYLLLRDHYRLEMVALPLISTSPQQGVKVKNVFITPGFYRYCSARLQNQWVYEMNPSQDLLRSLYTPWGLAVAACLEGDTARAIQLKPEKIFGTSETFAQALVAYHEGCYHLQQQQWRVAVGSLNLALTAIQAKSAWQEELDRLCNTQRQAISDFNEHLEFAQFWYELSGSQPARSYLAEYKAEQIREKIANEKISFNQALQELKKLKQIDPNNPVVLDLIERVEFSQEMEEIQALMKRDRFEEAVGRAKHSKHERTRYIVAEVCIEILLKGAAARELSPETLARLGRWAYDLCPDELAFQEVYRSLRIIY